MFSEDERKGDVLRKVGPYKIGQTLGKGGYSWVKRGLHEETQQLVALKFLQVDIKNFNSQRKQVHSEIKSLCLINNPHVIKILSYDLKCKYPDKNGKFRKTFLIVLEYCHGGELFDILKYTNKLDYTTARTYFIQLLKGLKACHDVGVVHRDIKPQNLLLNASYQLKICDFGLSFISKAQRLEQQTMKTMCGTRGFQAPELLKGERYTKSCDIFSCGVVLFILIVGYRPFEHAWREDKWYKAMCEKNPEGFWKTHSTVEIEDDIKELLNGMLAYRPRNRLTLEECFQHKWVAGQKVHNAVDLIGAVKEKHLQTRLKRRMDKRKMRQLENSIKREICGCKSHTHLSRYPGCTEITDMASFGLKIPVVKDFVPNLLTFFSRKSQLNEAYNAAFNVFNVALQGKSKTTFNAENPWEIKTLIKVIDVSEQDFSVLLNVCEIEGTEIVGFKFKRCLGDSLAFARIWLEVEECLLTFAETIFFDPFEEISRPMEENKIDSVNGSVAPTENLKA